MNPQHIHQNMGYLPLLAEEGLKVVNSYQGSVHLPPDDYHQPQTSAQQHYMPHYQVPGDGYPHHHHHPHDRMQGMYIGPPGVGGPGGGAGSSTSAADDINLHSFDDNRGGLVTFNQPQYLPKTTAPLPAEPKPKERSKKSKGGQPKKRARNPAAWKRNTNKRLRNSGQPYINSNGCVMPARKMKESCKNCRQRCPERISEEQRQEIFDDYWHSNKDWTYRRMYIIEHALPQPIQRRRSKRDLDQKARRISFHYHLTCDGIMEKVCKRFFLNTLAVGEKFVIISLHKKTVDGKVIPDRRGRHPAANQIPYDMKQEARRHIQLNILNRPQEQVSLPKMYDSYVQECEMHQRTTVKKHFYRKLMNEELRISQQRLEGPDEVRNEERPLDYTPTPQVSALECLIKELWQKEQERIRNTKPKCSLKDKLKEYHALRFGGKEYVNFKGQVRPSRKMKEPCENCQKACTEHITEEQRQHLFNNFWDPNKDWTEKKKYVLSCTESRPVIKSRIRLKRARAATRFGRPHRFTYFFEVDGKKVPVCRKYFVNTLGLSHNFIASCIAKQDENGDFDPAKRKKSGTLAKLPPAAAQEIRQHIIYNCWADPNKGREYQTHSSTRGWSWNVSKMYAAYRQCCWMRGTKPASTYMYRRVFCEEMKIFEESKMLTASTPSSSTRLAGKKQAESKSGKAASSSLKQATAQELSATTSADGPEGDILDNQDEMSMEPTDAENDKDYQPSSEEEYDEDDDDDDEDYTPPKRKAQVSAGPQCSVPVVPPEQMPETYDGEEKFAEEKDDELLEDFPSTSGQVDHTKPRYRPSDTADMRCAGQTYVNDKGNVIPARKIKEPCTNCRKQCLERVPQEMREKIFNMFWSKEMPWEKKRQYMEDCIEETAVKKRTLPASQMKLTRKVHMKYTLKLGDWQENVCKLFFLNTLGISQKFAIVSLRKQKERLLQDVEIPPFDPSDPVSLPDPVPLAPVPSESTPAPTDNADSSFRDVLSHLLLIPTSNMS
ncbi:uncharacterized protein LOC121413686 [Lytechinus variegatus]|uniref:uncharacterized protein LOC121413686 n=1 Tax=Lytechinus variegatus TaxID=7654 RepID=UPI001BB1187F|nr:uncharacterized protein LOC121413686 [Lytechinus variegatus]